jgi:hypothetical protein
MPQLETRQRQQASSTARNDCPECGGPLAVMRVLEGRDVDYWTMRCIRCGAIHLNIVESAGPP